MDASKAKSNSTPGATPRTPHSPSSAAGSSMASPRPGTSHAPVRPVTARTWQALTSAAPAEDNQRRVSVYNNDLYGNGPEALAGGAADGRPASPHYQPASARPGSARPASPLQQPGSARPGTPTPRSAERLQQQRIATPSRLQMESAASPRQRLQVASLGLSTANVPGVAAPAAASAPQSEPPPRPQQQQQKQQQGAAGGAAVTAAASSSRPTATGSSPAAGGQSSGGGSAVRQQPDPGDRPSTAPTKACPASQLRTSKFSISGAKQQQQRRQQDQPASTANPRPASAAGTSIAADSPRVRQQVLRNFAGAVPAGAAAGAGSGKSSGPTSPLGGSPRPMLHGERGRGSGSGARPSTPSFHPIAQTARPATALAGPSAPAAGGASAGIDAHFSIKASHGRTESGNARLMPGGTEAAGLGPVGAYPQPPMTAPPKAPAMATVPGGQQQPLPGSLASFGISSAAFVAVAPKLPGGKAATAGESNAGAGMDKVALQALTQAGMLEMISTANKAELRRLLLTPGPADKPLLCKILRSGGGLLKGSPQYTLMVEQEGGKGGVFLLAARKRKGGPGGSAYLLSVDQHDISRHSASCVGKVRSNFLGTEFVFHDAGDKEHKGSAGGRCELGAAMYQTNVLGTKGPRKMTVLIPKLEAGGQRPMPLSPRGEHDTLLAQYKSYNLSSSVVLRNKPPRWNQAMGAYCLNFGGRVTQASVKNFQLVSVDNMDRTILQFGKVGTDAFTMDYCYPMTALQAMMIALTSFDSKLACE